MKRFFLCVAALAVLSLLLTPLPGAACCQTAQMAISSHSPPLQCQQTTTSGIDCVYIQIKDENHIIGTQANLGDSEGAIRCDRSIYNAVLRNHCLAIESSRPQEALTQAYRGDAPQLWQQLATEAMNSGNDSYIHAPDLSRASPNSGNVAVHAIYWRPTQATILKIVT